MTSEKGSNDPDCQPKNISITGIKQSLLSPAYLHTNSTSHVWPFSAVAELIDNAYDPDVNATRLSIDYEVINGSHCLTFLDDGAGISPYTLYKMLSFGFCDKDRYAVTRHKPVGHYGNGFKSGSMRLGKDAIILSKHGDKKDCIASAGMLSQTYLEAVRSETILVPTVNFAFNTGEVIETPDSLASLRSITTYSIFKSKEEMIKIVTERIKKTGTLIIIYNLRKNKKGEFEFDFSTDVTDIRILEDETTTDAGSGYANQDRVNVHPTSHYSLRAYCSILFLRPKMQIYIRGRKVRSKLIKKSLSKTAIDSYRPQGVDKPLKITFGFNAESDNYGIMMYYRNRLIRSYVRVGYQLKPNHMGTGVVGVIECDYLTPTHNKQDFDNNKQYRSTMFALAQKLNDFWHEKCGDISAEAFGAAVQELVPDQLWIQCDNKDCLKWRKLPNNIPAGSIPDKWYCTNNADPNFANCNIPEEKDESEEAIPYVKTFKYKQRRLKAEETKRIANIIMQRQAQAQAQNVNNTPSPIITVGQNMANNRTVPGYNVYNQVPQQNPAGDDEITIIADKPGGKTLDPSMPITQQVINHVMNNSRNIPGQLKRPPDLPNSMMKKRVVNPGGQALFVVDGPATISEMKLTAPADQLLVTKLTKLHPKTRWNLLVSRTMQLRDLRSQVCSLLHMLVPELDQNALGVANEPVDGKKLPSLLDQVLEVNQNREQEAESPSPSTTNTNNENSIHGNSCHGNSSHNISTNNIPNHHDNHNSNCAQDTKPKLNIKQEPKYYCKSEPEVLIIDDD